ncbi:MAG: hypothetical protein IJ121_03715 [Eubacterium sp.]|nr:hypothetical protein [Eubacterium sp.]
MNSEKDLSALLERIQDYQETEHQKNRRRIRNGFRSMLIVPTIIFILMFLSEQTGTSKLVMLVVWIVSMLLIAAYLIVVDFVDYKLMHVLESKEAAVEEIADASDAADSPAAKAAEAILRRTNNVQEDRS